MKIFLIGIASLIGIVLIGYFFDAAGIVEIKLFGVKQENARRQVFEQTQSFNDGKRQELLHYKLQYELEKDPTSKAAIKYTILHSMAGYDESRLDPSLAAFLNTLRN